MMYWHRSAQKPRAACKSPSSMAATGAALIIALFCLASCPAPPLVAEGEARLVGAEEIEASGARHLAIRYELHNRGSLRISYAAANFRFRTDAREYTLTDAGETPLPPGASMYRSLRAEYATDSEKLVPGSAELVSAFFE